MKDRFQCEVRHVLKLAAESQSRSDDYLEAVRKARGKAEAEKLRQAAKEQWILGNRGDWDDWRTR